MTKPIKLTLFKTENVPRPQRDLFAAIRATAGRVPNVYAALAHSPVVLEAYLQFSGALDRSVLPPLLREKIALAVSRLNGCDYCARAHFAIGRSLGGDVGELQQNLSGTSGDERDQIALSLATEIIRNLGRVSDDSLRNALDVFGERGVVEIHAVVVITLFTNYFNHLAGTAVDFPPLT